VPHQHFTHFVDKESIRPATERSHFNELYLFALGSTPFGGFQNTIGICPLRNEMDVVDPDLFVSYQIIGYDMDSHLRDHVGYFVLYQWVAVIRATGKHHGQCFIFPDVLQYFFVIGNDFLLKSGLFVFCFLESRPDGIYIYVQTDKEISALLEEQLSVLESDNRRVYRHTSGIHAFDYFGISRYDGAIIAVLFFIFLLEHDKRHEYPVHFLLQQVIDVAMYQLGRKADVIRHDHACTVFIT